MLQRKNRSGTARSASRRRGIVLIVVVAILVMLAMMATAYLSATRLDRVAIDQKGGAASGAGAWLSVDEGSMNAAQTAVLTEIRNKLVEDVFPGGRYRPRDVNYFDTDYLLENPATSGAPGANQETWLASRTPEMIGGNIAWPVIGESLYGSAFSAPGMPTPYTGRHGYRPSFKAITYAGAPGTGYPGTVLLQGKTRVYPAWTDGSIEIIAGDTDGDGIADAGLMPLNSIIPDTTVSYSGDTDSPRPVRYYAAYRIVDQNSAVNVNTAGKVERDTLFNGNAAPNFGFFRSNVGLYELLRTPIADRDGQWTVFEQFRFGTTAANPSDRPVDDNGMPRTDFTYSTISEAIEMQLARRIGNPGPADGGHFQAFPLLDSTSLAYHLGMVNPGLVRTDIETRLWLDTYYHAPNYDEQAKKRFAYFPADKIELWYHSLFNWDTATRNAFFSGNYGGYALPALPVRPWLTTYNPQSNLMHGPAFVGASNVLNDGGGSGRAAMEPYLQGTETSPRPPKVSLNTDEFPTLWRGFWSVMADSTNPEQPASGGAFAVVTPFTNPTEMLQLRSAIAAVNVEDMRDEDDEITSRRIQIGTFDVMVFGTERQVFIERVAFADPTADLAVRLHNPNTVSLGLDGYTLALLDRGSQMIVPGSVRPLSGQLDAGNSRDETIPSPGNLADPTVGKDFDVVLFRTRSGLAGGGSNLDPTNEYDESNLTEQAPMDSVDLNNAPTTPPGPARYQRSTANWFVAYGDSSAAWATDAGEGATTDGRAFPVAVDNTPGPADPYGLGGATRVFPYGGFARAGDAMLVPYVGSFTVYDGGSPLAIAPLTIDATNITDPGAGQVRGRLMPPAGAPSAWERRVLDVFTAQHNPHNDYLPNISPDSYGGAPPAAVPNGGGVTVIGNANGDAERNVPIHGLININTASAQVLATLPLVVDDNGFSDYTANLAMAMNIVAYRQANGPFQSLFDLNNVSGFAATNALPAQGNFIVDPEFVNYAQAYTNVNRLSNLATVRSDAFIVYVLIQAWQDYNTPYPVLLGERRTAMLLDRASLNAMNNTSASLVEVSVGTE